MIDAITIVAGLPRSGTSLTMQMLESGGAPVLVDGIRAADEDNPRGYYEFEAVKRTAKDPSWLQGASGKAVKMVHRLLYELPADRDYRVVFVRRTLQEVVVSQRVMLERQGKTGAGLPDGKLIQLFQNELDTVAAWLAARPNFSVLEVTYQGLLAAPHDSAQRINEFLGGALDVDSMAAAVDPSLYRNRHQS
jgi:hypothetical protein